MGNEMIKKVSRKGKKVLIYSWNIPLGGLAKVLLKEVEYFNKQNVSLVFCTSSDIPIEYEESLRKEGIKQIRINTEKSIFSLIIKSFFEGISDMSNVNVLQYEYGLFTFLKREHPDILVCHQLLSSIIAKPYAILFRRKSILVLHDNPFLFLNPMNLRRNSLLVKAVKKFMYLIALFNMFSTDTIACTTPQIANEIGHIQKLRKKINITEYGFDRFPEVPIIRRKMILTVSKWSRFRLPITYLEVLKLLPSELKLTIAGRWEFQKDLLDFKEAVLSKGLSERVVIITGSTEDELNELYDRTKVFVRLGFNESGTGQAILEALSHGCPVVISATLGAANLIQNGKEGYLVDERNLETIAHLISEIYNNNQLFFSMSKAAYALAETKSWDSYLKKILELAS